LPIASFPIACFLCNKRPIFAILNADGREHFGKILLSRLWNFAIWDFAAFSTGDDERTRLDALAELA